jgi:predicted ATPase/class 3 adenylate cyclase
MRKLPRGTVTFLFTDIEGSTRLLEELGDEYAGALADHRRLLRAAFERHGGVEVDTQGDAFFVAFERAKDALEAAAAEAQRALAAGRIRVRMGIHTGEPLRTGEGYAGMDVHRGARIAAAGHGGQVLVSETTYALVGDELSPGLALHDLEEHRLKDLSRPHRLFQLVGEGLRVDFPPLSTLEGRPTNLPPQPTPLIGREREVAEIVELLRRSDVRLATVTGPAGAGKTRLALQAAADLLPDFTDGVYFVPLAPLGEPALVLPTIGQTLGVRELSGFELVDVVAEFLRRRQLLLLLDNFEHLVEAAPEVAGLLARAPSTKMLVTSRAGLRVSGEHEYPIPELAEDEAVALFSERARAVRPDFRLNGDTPAVAEICRRLDALPLAIELAAARSKILSPAALLERLSERLNVLTTGARDLPERQRTLRGAIAWSHDLLTEPEQAVFEGLGAFAGGFTFEAADQVCGADLDTIGSLVEKSLVRQSEDRFRMLETIREYALERLRESGRLEVVSRRHAEYFLALSEGAQPEGRLRSDASLWLARLEAEHDNLRAALQHARMLEDGELELRLAASFAVLWEAHSHLHEGLEHLRQALARGGDAPSKVRGRALRWGAITAYKLREIDLGRSFAMELRDLAGGDEALRGQALHMLATISMGEDRLDESRSLLEEAKAIRERLQDRVGMQSSLHNLGCVALYEGDFDRAAAELEAALSLSTEFGLEVNRQNDLSDLSFALLGLRDYGSARARLGDALEAGLRLGWPENIAYCLLGFAAVAVADGEPDRAARLLGHFERILQDIHLGLERYAEDVRLGVERDLRSQLGEDRFLLSRAEGAALTLEAVVSEARTLRPRL